jgi:hypothetical protein
LFSVSGKSGCSGSDPLVVFESSEAFPLFSYWSEFRECELLELTFSFGASSVPNAPLAFDTDPTLIIDFMITRVSELAQFDRLISVITYCMT